MEKIVELPPPPNPDPGQAKMQGELTNFTIELLHVVEVLFNRFAFTAETGKKLEVAVELDPGTPVRFIDDLEFVEELRKNIPPDLFGDGPSLDISPAGVKAGFSIGLPPVGVGVFSLREVVLSAFLELPFLDGRPTFDFSFSAEHPFNLTVIIFGGAAPSQIDTLGIKMLGRRWSSVPASIDLSMCGRMYMWRHLLLDSAQDDEGEEVDAAIRNYLRLGELDPRADLGLAGILSIFIRVAGTPPMAEPR
jgi:hypothetical protein